MQVNGPGFGNLQQQLHRRRKYRLVPGFVLPVKHHHQG
tara:strand:+ start:340 stop:453 length:114 start_codon:yes stop_codon:yes gene_type:complete